MEKEELLRTLFTEQKISLQELVEWSVLSIEEIEKKLENQQEEVLSEKLQIKEQTLNEALALIKVRDAYAPGSTNSIGYSKQQDNHKVVDYINKTILKLLKQTYG